MNREDEIARSKPNRGSGGWVRDDDIDWLVRVARAARETIEVFIDASTPQQRVDAMEELRTLLSETPQKEGNNPNK